MAKDKTVTFTLKFTVEILPNGTPEKTLRENLAGIIEYALNRGLITGETPAEVVGLTAHCGAAAAGRYGHIEITRKGT